MYKNVMPFKDDIKLAELDKSKGKFNNSSGEPPSGGNYLEKRIEKLESGFSDIKEKLARVETKIDSIEKHGATKEDIAHIRTDMEKMQSSLVKWFVGTAIAMVIAASSLSFTLARMTLSTQSSQQHQVSTLKDK